LIPTPTWNDVRERARFQVLRRASESNVPAVSMNGILLAPYDIPAVRFNVLPSSGRWDVRSGKRIDFLWPGYSAYGVDAPDSVPVELPEGVTRPDFPRFFSASRFVSFSDELSNFYAEWRYSEGVEMVFFNTEYIPSIDSIVTDSKQFARISLTNVVGIPNAGRTIEELCSAIFSYVEEVEGSTRVEDFIRIWEPTSPLWQRLARLAMDNKLQLVQTGVDVASLVLMMSI
jgi:hypothetical protein